MANGDTMEVGRDHPLLAEVNKIAEAMEDAIPDGSNAGLVVGALGKLLVTGILQSLDTPFTEDRALAIYDGWAEHQRKELVRCIALVKGRVH